jgi:peptide/nickel transport system substrate-binding protein
MKRVFAVALLVGLLSIIGCSPSGTASSTSSKGKTKDTIVFCQGNDLTTMDASIGQQERAYSLSNHMFDTLFTYNTEMKMIPCLALSYTWKDDVSLMLVLRKGVKFHDGTEMTAEDVAYTMDLINQRGALFVGNYKNCEIVDGYTVIIHLKKPNPALVSIFTLPQAAVLPKNAYSKDPDGFGSHPVGTGPYKLDKFAEGDFYSLVRFDDYWGEKAKTKSLTMRIVPEPSQRTILLETGKVDAAYDIPINDVQRVKKNKKLQLMTCPSMKVILIEFNCASTKAIGNAKVRNAIECAIDKQTIVTSLLAGYGTVADSIVPKSAQDYREYATNQYDPAKAKSLLAEAGYADGFQATLWTNANQTNTEIAQVLQSQLAKVGVKLDIVVQDDNTTFSQVEAGADYDLILDFWQTNSGHADYVFNGMYYSTSVNNFSRYKNKEFDTTYREYASTGEGEKREALLKKLYAFIAADKPAMALYNESKVIAATANMEGLKLSQIGAHEYQDAVVYVH